jgi:hypothetical protein
VLFVHRDTINNSLLLINITVMLIFVNHTSNTTPICLPILLCMFMECKSIYFYKYIVWFFGEISKAVFKRLTA